MLSTGIRRPKDATLLDGPNHTCHIKSQSLKIAYNKAIVTKWSIGKMDHVALPLWDAIPASKSCKRTGGGRLLSWAPSSKGDQTLWRSPRWGPWSLFDPDIFRRTSVASLLRRHIENGSARKYYRRSGGSTCLPTELCNPSCILINWAIFQQCSRIQCSLNQDANRRWGVKNLEAYDDSKLIVNQVRGEYKVRDEDLVPYHNATIYMAERFRNFYIDHVPCQ